MGRTCNGLRSLEARGNSYRRRSDWFLPAKPCELQASQARRVFRNGTAQEHFRQGTEEDSARAFLDVPATRCELTQNCERRQTMINKQPTIVIVGGGFAGLAAAKSLRQAPVHVVLIDRTNHHLFQPLLYQVATS